jgi:hypothetical protein
MFCDFDTVLLSKLLLGMAEDGGDPGSAYTGVI